MSLWRVRTYSRLLSCGDCALLPWLGDRRCDTATALYPDFGAATSTSSSICLAGKPRRLERSRRGLVALAAGLFAAVRYWFALLGVWALIGAGCSFALTPGARLLRRSAASSDRPALFAADFALSHACWLICYPLAGWVATEMGTPAAFVALITGPFAQLVAA